MPAQRPLSIWKENTLDQEFRFKAGTFPFDLTGSTLIFRAVPPDGTPLRKELTITESKPSSPNILADVTGPLAS